MFRKILFTPVVLLSTILSLHAQDTLFYENFNSGTAGAFTLNTTDVGSVTDPGSYNFWLVNNAYTGGSGSLMCLGFPFTYTINNTPAQPSGIAGFPNSHYLHTLSDEGFADGIFCSSFAAADGICFLDQNIFARMTSDISTVGKTGTTLSFWWTCGGGTNIHGELYYSTNGGSSWTQVTSPVSQYKNQLTWTQTSISLPAWDGQPTLRFGFRFFDAASTAALDPGMSVDDMTITATTTVATVVSTDSVSALEFCQGDYVMVSYTATGTYGALNVFEAHLSNAAGSFASPTVIGSIAGTAGSGSFGATIPAGAAQGTGYRIRVMATSPATTGTDNGADITIWEKPVFDPLPATDSICEGTSALIPSALSAGTMEWMESTDGITFSPTGITTPTLTTPPLFSDTWYYAWAVNGTCDTVLSDTVHIIIAASPVASFTSSSSGLTVNFTNTSTGAVAYTWDFGDGSFSSLTSPSHAYVTAGAYVVTLIAVSAYGCTDTLVDTLDVLVHSESTADGAEFSFAPNPFTDAVTFTFEGGMEDWQIEIYSIEGKKILSQFQPAGSKSWTWLPGPGIPSGVYVLKLSGGGTFRSFQLIRE